MTKLGNQNKIISRKFACYSRKFASILGFLFVFLITPSLIEAAILYLEPSSSEYYQGDTFIVNLKIDTEQECVNAVKADLKFSQNLMEAVDFSKGESILTLWVEEPEINQDLGLISFTGGAPGGYCGRIPGDPGTSNLLGKVIFRVVSRDVSPSSAQVIFQDNSQVLLNDGFGTPAKLSTEGAVFNILPKPFDVAQGRDEWQEELKKDQIPPEPFVIEVRQDSEIFEGKYYLVFSTSDKQTGLDRYEVIEGDEAGFQRGTTQKAEWEIRDSPYLLEDQELQSIIKVKAIDKAGNERIVEVGPIKPFIPPAKKPFPYWIIVLIGAGGGIIWWIIRKLKSKKRGFHKLIRI